MKTNLFRAAYIQPKSGQLRGVTFSAADNAAAVRWAAAWEALVGSPVLTLKAVKHRHVLVSGEWKKGVGCHG